MTCKKCFDLFVKVAVLRGMLEGYHHLQGKALDEHIDGIVAKTKALWQEQRRPEAKDL